MRRFVGLPWRIYRDDPAWVPPLRSDVRKLLRRRHPFFQHSEAEYFLAFRGPEAVGRIAAIVNRAYNRFHGAHTGFVGLFECVDDAEVAASLLDAAAGWLRSRGMTGAMGPFNLSTNDELYSPGVLVEGFDREPALLMAHSPPYYAGLFAHAGWTKVRDLLAYRIARDAPPDRLVRALDRAASALKGLEVRPLDPRRLEREVEAIREVYNSAWERNWGFTPLADAEVRHLARQLRPILDPRIALIAEVHGRPAAFALAFPDYNQVLRHVDGRLLPTGFLKVLFHRRRIDRIRVMALGLRPEHRLTGLDALLYLRVFQNGLAAGYREAEASWILEDNWPMRRGLERMGGVPYKTYRVFETTL